jgi:MoaA/NifB/PqqE/SkfB family radical SAM enzyme
MSVSIYSWSKFAGRAVRAAFGVERGVLTQKIVLVVTKRCHSRCVYCDIWKVKDTPGGLDGELTGAELSLIAKSNPGLQWIDFTGGEPTDRPDFAEVVEAFDSSCKQLLLVHFPTNGLATEKISRISQRLHRSLRSRLIVTVSIDGPPEINDRLRGVKRDFFHAIATFCAVRRELGESNVYVGMTLHGHTGSCGRSTLVLLEETYAAINRELATRNEAPLAWSGLHLNIPHISQHYYGNESVVASKDIADSGAAGCDEIPALGNNEVTVTADGFGGSAHRAEVAEALRFAAQQSRGGSFGLQLLERAYRNEAMRYLTTGLTRVPCAALLTTAYLSSKGEVYPCTIWDKPLGNVRDYNYELAPIVAQSRANGVRAAVKAGKCPRCWTPCEAYPALAASPLRATQALFS